MGWREPPLSPDGHPKEMRQGLRPTPQMRKGEACRMMLAGRASSAYLGPYESPQPRPVRIGALASAGLPIPARSDLVRGGACPRGAVRRAAVQGVRIPGLPWQAARRLVRLAVRLHPRPLAPGGGHAGVP